MNVQKAAEYAQHTHATAPKTQTQETQKKNTTQAADNTDKLITDNNNSTAYSPAYTRGSNKSSLQAKGDANFNSSMSAMQMKNQAMQSYVKNTLSGQKTTGSGYQALYGNNSVISGALSAAEKTSEKYDDYWGVDATAERIFTFAKSLAGEDEAMLKKMEDAFQKGFNQALGAKKGSLPSISYQTKDKVTELFSSYKKELADKKSGKTTEETDAAKTTDTAKSTETSKKASTPYVGGGKYGSTPPPTKYSGGEKVPYTGNEKYGKSYTE